MWHEVFLREMGCEAGEEAGQDAADDKGREVQDNGTDPGKEACGQYLPKVVENGAYDAGKVNIMLLQQPVDGAHGDKAEKAACQAVQDAEHLARKESGQENPHEQHKEGIGWLVIQKQDEGYDIR